MLYNAHYQLVELVFFAWVPDIKWVQSVIKETVTRAAS